MQYRNFILAIGLFVVFGCGHRAGSQTPLTAFGVTPPATRTLTPHADVVRLYTACNVTDPPFTSHCGTTHARYDAFEVHANAVVTAVVENLTDDVIAWSNHNKVMLDLPCDSDIPVEVEYLSCTLTEMSHIGHLRTARKLRALRIQTEMEVPRGWLNAHDVAKFAHLDRLSYLDVGGLRVLDEALEVIGTMESIEILKVSSQGHYTVVGLRYLQGLPRLQSLDISGFSLGDEGADALGDFQSLSQLRYLDLRNTGFRDDDLGLLRKAPSLQYLDLSNNRLDTSDIKRISKMPALKIVEFYGQPHLAKALQDLRPDIDARFE